MTVWAWSAEMTKRWAGVLPMPFVLFIWARGGAGPGAGPGPGCADARADREAMLAMVERKCMVGSVWIGNIEGTRRRIVCRSKRI